MRFAAALLLALLILAESLSAALTREQLRVLSKRPKIERIEIQGNQAFSTKTIRRKIYSREDGFWQSVGLMRSNRFTKVNLFRDKIQLEFFYRSEGFDDVEVTIDFVEAEDPEKVVLLVQISEGVLFRTGTVSVEGELGHQAEKVHNVVKNLQQGDKYNRLIVDAIRQGIRAVYGNSGYPYAEVTSQTDKDSAAGLANVTLFIARNQLVLFGKAEIDTTLRTRPEVFRREISFNERDIYSRERLIESQERLIRTGLFNFVSLRTPAEMTSRDSLMPPFYVSGVERPAGFVNLGVGAGQDEEVDFTWNVSGTVGNRNIRGTARKMTFRSALFVALQDSVVLRPRFEFNYTEPYLFKLRLPLLLTFRYEPRSPSPVQNYKIRTISADVTAIREFSLKTRLSTSLNYEEVDISIDGRAQEDTVAVRLRDELGISVNRRLILQLERDSRPVHSRLHPASGSFTLYRVEYVGGILGGDNDFVKLLYSWSRYLSLRSGSILATRIRAGWVNEFGTSKSVPSKERFYLGGAYSIRGFPENDFGPRDEKGNAIGGEAIGLINVEIRHQLVGKFWGSVFVDTGFNEERIRRVSFRRFGVSTGAGLQFISPVGPIRVDYGHRVGINEFDAGGQFHFGILYAF